MRQNGYSPNSAEAISRYFSKASLPSQQETLGQIVIEILKDGRNLNRKSICTKLLGRLEQVSGPDEEQHYHELIALLFDRED